MTRIKMRALRIVAHAIADCFHASALSEHQCKMVDRAQKALVLAFRGLEAAEFVDRALLRELEKLRLQDEMKLKQRKEPETVTAEDEQKAKDGPVPEETPPLPLRKGGRVDPRRAT